MRGRRNAFAEAVGWPRAIGSASGVLWDTGCDMLRSWGRFGLAWQAGALKCRPRDRFIGWKPSQQVERLHHVASNTRLLSLPEPGGLPNLRVRLNFL